MVSRLPSPRRAITVAMLSSAVTLAPSRAAAADKPPPRTSSLSFIRLPGADGCVSTQDLARDVEGRLGRPVFVSPARADVSIEGHIAPLPKRAGFKATIILRDVTGAHLGTRELTRSDASCADMRDPLALVIAVMIDPDAALERPPAETPREEAPPPAAAPAPAPALSPSSAPVPPAPPPPVARAEEPWRLDAGASGALAVGLLPDLAPGLHVDGLLTPPRFVPLLVFGQVWLDDTTPAGSPGHVTFSLLEGGAGLCPLAHRAARWSLYGCAAGQLGALEARGERFDVAQPAQRKLYLAGAVAARLSVRLAGPFAFRFGAGGVVPVQRDTFVYRRSDGTSGEVFRPAPVALVMDAGLGVLFP